MNSYKVLLRIQVSLLKWSTHGNWQIIYPKSNLLTSPVPTEYFATNVFNYLHAAFKNVSLNEAESRSQVAPHVYSLTLHKCLNANLPHSWSGQVGTRMHSWLLKNNQFLIPERKTNLLINILGQFKAHLNSLVTVNLYEWCPQLLCAGHLL